MEYHKYLRIYEDYFWTIGFDSSLGATEYVFPSGGIIAFPDHIIEILEFLSDQSWPPFGSLLLAIIATNHNASVDLDQVYKYAKSKEKASAFPNANLFKIEASLDFLKILASLPVAYKTGDKQLLLFQTIFENCHNRISREKAKLFLQDLKNHGLDNIVVAAFNDANFTKDFRTIALLKTKFPTAQSIIEAIENSPEKDIVFEENELDQDPISDKPKDFVEQLIEENKTFHVGSLLKRIWSGLNIPLHHNTPSQQPLGGISDLTNKGDFDKLLISEFANDDLIFMSRLANNEALYIQREIPPEDDKFKRILLIDSSLKNWGNPKIINFATALAIAKHPKTDIECHIIVLGSDFQEVGFEDINQVIDGLTVLSGKLDCAEGLHSYFQSARESGDVNENFLILSENSLKSTAMQRIIHENFEYLKYLITTNEEGTITIYKIKNKAKKHLKTIHLSLDELWRTNAKRHAFENIEANQNLPILYPVAKNYQTIFHYNGIFYTVLRGKLFQFVELSKGFLKIADGIPFTSGEFAMFKNDKGDLILINANSEHIEQYNITAQKSYRDKVPTTQFFNNVSLFTENDNAFIKNSRGYFKFSSGGFKNDLDDKSNAFQNYTTILADFKKRLSNSKNKYNIIVKMENIWIDETKKYIDFNNYGFVLNKLSILNLEQNQSFRAFETYVDLILKNPGKNKVEIIKLIKSNYNKSLFEARELIEGELKVILENVTVDTAENAKYEIEDLGAICYLKVKSHQSPDGSIITCNNGIATLESSNKAIPTIFIPLVININTAMSTDFEFAGNEYFLPKENRLTIISVEDFHQKYISPFINTILEHGT